MAPEVVSGKAAKKASKVKVLKVDRNEKKQRRNESCPNYMYNILCQFYPDTGISSMVVSIMNSFVSDIVERIAAESSHLAYHNKRSTATSKEMQTALSLPSHWVSLVLDANLSCKYMSGILIVS
ncbi:hypothetical protein P879_07363 [Paragonimus westermani]|uniref:Core Histone H2A/H2B/H3 domain-containing protein n=1 Tax=Paragonimus westermani TaxID=34504 RepID=A0A8T0D439_9TREM|nr:hypothetical protein P879_07363 [Paragonimus westermani]